jgi:hypothetical protein
MFVVAVIIAVGATKLEVAFVVFLAAATAERVSFLLTLSSHGRVPGRGWKSKTTCSAATAGLAENVVRSLLLVLLLLPLLLLSCPSMPQPSRVCVAPSVKVAVCAHARGVLTPSLGQHHLHAAAPNAAATPANAKETS